MVGDHNEREIDTFLRLYEAEQKFAIGTVEGIIASRKLNHFLRFKISHESVVIFASVLGSSKEDVVNTYRRLIYRIHDFVD